MRNITEMYSLWICLLFTCLSSVSGFLGFHIDCSRHYDSEWVQNYCKHHSESSSSQHSNGDSGPDSFGCDHVYYKDRVNLIWNDWHKNGDDDVVKQLYYDLLVSLQTGSSSSLPDKREITKRKTVHDEAYYHYNTDPDYPHVRDLVYNHMNEKCRMEIIQQLEKDLQFLQTTTHHHHHHTHAPTTTTTKATTHVHRATTHMTHKPTTMKPTTQQPTTAKPTTVKPTTSHPTTQQPTTAKPTTLQPTTKHVTAVPTTMSGTTNSLSTLPKMITTSYRCNLLKFVTTLSHSAKVANQNAGLCTDGSHTESEALVMDTCNVPVTPQWTKGANVGSNCKNIPPYTPIATFVFDSYVQSSSELAGILVECTADGFKIKVEVNFAFIGWKFRNHEYLELDF